MHTGPHSVSHRMEDTLAATQRLKDWMLHSFRHTDCHVTHGMEGTLTATHRDQQIGGYTHSYALIVSLSVTEWRTHYPSLTETHRLEGTLIHTH